MYTKATNKAVQKYSKKAYSVITVRVKKGQEEQIKSFAESRGLSLNGYINKLIADDMGADLTVPKQGET